MFGMDENRGATQARGIPVQVAGEIGPREFSLNQIFARATGGHGDDRLRARPKSKSQAAITFSFGAPKRDGLVCRPPRELDIYGTTFGSRWVDFDPDDLPHDLFIADEPSVLHTEDGHVRIGFCASQRWNSCRIPRRLQRSYSWLPILMCGHAQ